MDGLETNKSIQNSDYSHILRDLLVYLRGNESQSQLSFRMGFQFNQVGKWETGHTLFYWQDFIRLCDLKSIPWQDHLRETLIINPDFDIDHTSILETLRIYISSYKADEMHKHFNKSRSSLIRLLHNQVKTDFHDVLSFMDTKPLVFLSWLSQFTDVNSLPSLQQRVRHANQIFQGLLAQPWTLLVNAALHLDEYAQLSQHSDLWIAKKVGLHGAQVHSSLQTLSSSGIILPTANGKYTSFLRDMSFLRSPNFRKVTHYLTKKMAEVFDPLTATSPNPERPSLSSTRIYPLSSAASRKVAEAIIHFHNTVGEILKQDNEPKDHVRTILIHSLDTEYFSNVSESEANISYIEN